MKRIILCFAAVFFLVACSAPVVATATLVPQPLTPTPTQIQATETLVPTDTVTPVPTLDPDAWNEAGNMVWQNKDLAPYGKQLVVNPEFQSQFVDSVFTLCNQYTFLAEMANEIQKRKNSSPLPDQKYQSFENYMDLVINPAIKIDKTVEGYHLVGHEKRANKSPEVGMVKPLEKFDPSVCSIRIVANSRIYPSGPVIDAGAFHIGMNLVKKDEKVIRELVIAVDQTVKNNYGIFYASDKTTADENSIAYSQMFSTAFGQFDNLADMIPKSENSTYISQFVLGKSVGSQAVEMMFSVPGTAGLEKIKNWMANSPSYLHTP